MKNKKLSATFLAYILSIIFFVFYAFPFVLIIINSFKSNGEILTNPFSLPTSWSFSHFGEVIEKMNFSITFRNSLIITIVSVVCILLFSSMAAYHILRKPTRYNKIFFSVLIASMAIPFQTLMIPLIHIYGARLHVIHEIPIPTLIAFYIGFGSALATFMYHGFMKSIPLEIEEAAKIDGCNSLQTFFLVVFPLLKSITVTIAVLNVMWIWNDYLLPSLVLNNEEVFTMPVKMKVFFGTYMNDWALLIPSILMTILPILVFYMFGQKYIISGVTQGSIK